jgi:hypothetical protein
MSHRREVVETSTSYKIEASATANEQMRPQQRSKAAWSAFAWVKAQQLVQELASIAKPSTNPLEWK